jgi:hypothetical protein
MATLTKAAKKSGARKRPSSSATRNVPRTARPGETAAHQRARLDRIAAQRRTAQQHQEHPELRADSVVRHAEPQTGKQRGEGAGGFPSGEYDVTPPKSATEEQPATEGVTAGQTADTSHDALLDAHFGAVDIEALQQQLGENRRLDDAELPLILEALPVGAVIEHEAPNRWRVRSPTTGGNRFGHGATGVQAIEAYVLGDVAPTADAAGAQRFLALPAAQQQEIRERDQKAAERVGGTPDTFARDEAIKAAESDQTAKAPASNAVTDGPEKASARAEQGTRGAQNTPGQSRPAAKSTSKTAAKKGASKSSRSGAKRR